MLLNRLDRYLLREVTWTFIAVTGVLLVVLMSNQFARVLGQAAQNDFPGVVVATLIGLTTLQYLTVLVPIGLFLGIVLALGRLYHESEMTAMNACGVGTLRVVSARERSQLQNRRAALARLAELLARGLARPAPRTATRPTRASKIARVEAKKLRGAIKAHRTRPAPDAD